MFLTNPSFGLVETYFLYWKQYAFVQRSFLMLETIVEIKGNQFKKENIFLLVEIIFLDFLAGRSSFFRIKETDLEVETDFLAGKNHFLYIFPDTPTGESFSSV